MKVKDCWMLSTKCLLEGRRFSLLRKGRLRKPLVQAKQQDDVKSHRERKRGLINKIKTMFRK